MSFTDAPNYLTQLRTQLDACAAWNTAGGSSAQIHYPSATPSAFPCAILGDEGVRYEKFAYGAAPLPSGDLNIFLSDLTSTGKLEQLARSIAAEICTDIGLINLSVSGITPATEPSAADYADGTALVYECTISLSFGVTA